MSLKPYYNHAGITVYNGECSKVMKDFESNSIDTIITDPPYALEFMGKGWDKVLPDVEVWKEALRVAKPGSMLLAFGGTRTYHRLTCNIEDAGWEIKDCMMWLYGSGFPKSLDISKQIDKRAGVERKVIGRRIDGRYAYDFADNSGNVVNTRDVDKTIRRNDIGLLTAPAISEAQLWNGWGTALKPAWEPIIVAMKPIDGTFANNALKWGVGGLNIDGGRIPFESTPNAATNPLYRKEAGYKNKQATDLGSSSYSMKKSGSELLERNINKQGRFPANLILDEKAAEMLDEQAGECKTGGAQKGSKIITDRGNSIFGKMYVNTYSTAIGEPLGGHSRFFYCAKASKAERGEENNHPTVKPLKLMEYLCKLTMTPTGGVVLDPFMGSGTTGVACKILNRVFVGIEKDPEYFEIAKKRIEGAD